MNFKKCSSGRIPTTSKCTKFIQKRLCSLVLWSTSVMRISPNRKI
eukprot:UN24947